MKNSYYLVLLVSIILFFSSSANAQSGVEELRYSSEIEEDDKFTWDVTVLTDDGSDLSSQGDHFGRIISESRVEFKAIKDPSKDNLVNKSSDKIFDIFKIEVDKSQVTKAENLGILPFLIMPTQLTLIDGEYKNYINYLFNEELNGTVKTDKNNFIISIKTLQITFFKESISVSNWDLTYNRETGVLQEMKMAAKSIDNDNLELQIELKLGFFRKLLPFPSLFVIVTFLILVPTIRMLRVKNQL